MTMKNERDPLYEEAVWLMLMARKPSIALLQRQLKIGFLRAEQLKQDILRIGVIFQEKPQGGLERGLEDRDARKALRLPSLDEATFGREKPLDLSDYKYELTREKYKAFEQDMIEAYLFCCKYHLTVAIWLDYCDLTRHRYGVLEEYRITWPGAPI
jgi:hypothetical protein